MILVIGATKANTMRHVVLLFCFLLCLTIPLYAQDVAYATALQRIQEATETGATELDLSSLSLTELPKEIGQLTNLQELYLTGNQLRTLPSEIDNLGNLQVLEVAYNNLSSLPPEIGQLSSLKVLSVPGNQLSSLPPEIGQLSSLCYLDLSANRLQSLPQELGQLYQLTVIDCDSIPAPYTFIIYGNPLSSLPNPSSIQYDPPAILEYLRNEAAWHLKQLIIAGASGVGLLAALMLGLRYRQTRRKSKVKRDYA